MSRPGEKPEFFLICLTGINFLAFQRLKLYIHLRPTKDNCFSGRSSAPHHSSRSPQDSLSPLLEPDFSDTTPFGVFPEIDSGSPQPVALPCSDRESRHPLHHRFSKETI